MSMREQMQAAAKEKAAAAGSLAKEKGGQAAAKAAEIAKEEGAKAAAVAKEKAPELKQAAREKVADLHPERIKDWESEHHTHTHAEESAATKLQAITRGNAARAASAALGPGKEMVLAKARSTAANLAQNETEPTIDRRNVLMTRNSGDVEKSLGQVTNKGLLTDRLPGLAASSIPFVGVAYNMINPVWEQMRAVCLVAALYGHDMESDDIQAQILTCVMGDRAEMKARCAQIVNTRRAVSSTTSCEPTNQPGFV